MNDELIIRILAGAASSPEIDAMNRWRGQSPENEEYFQETLRAWTATTPPPHVHSAASRRRIRSVIEETDRRGAGRRHGSYPPRS